MLKNMNGVADRNARFRTSICLFDGTQTKFFDGYCEGEIIDAERGDGGFGYDAIFQPKRFEKTFAEMDKIEKNTISHRRLAINNLAEYLKTI